MKRKEINVRNKIYVSRDKSLDKDKKRRKQYTPLAKRNMPYYGRFIGGRN